MPPTAARIGSTNRLRSRSSPRSSSRRASSPRTKKKNVIRQLFTHSRRGSETPASPTSSASVVSHSDSYDDAWMFTHARAATAAASKTAAPPVSVRRNSRSGVRALRDHARWPDAGRLGVQAGLAQRPALPQEIPTLVERNLQLVESPPIGVACRTGGLPVPKLMLLGYQLLDRRVDLPFIHLEPPEVEGFQSISTAVRGEAEPPV